MLSFLCECDDLRCDERIELSPAEYERLPLEPPGLALVPGHAAGESASWYE